MRATGTGLGEGTAVDRMVENGGRWTASRLTRRSFLGRMSQLAVLVAGGPAMATLLADRAEARVCGQTGVSPLCPTFDCDDVWGYCWYATGCCSDGLLKKICDCCAVAWPNVHGYCPDGTNVKCIVESCGSDPRVQTVAITRLSSDSVVEVAAMASGLRFPAAVPEVVLGDGDSALFGAVAMPLGVLVGGPVLLVGRGGLDGRVLGEIERLGARSAKIAGSALPPAIDAALVERGIAVERVGTAPEPEAFSAEVASWVYSRFGYRPCVCIENAGLSAEAAPLAAAFAAAGGWPLAVGAGSRGPAERTFLVGPEAVARAGEVVGAVPVGGATLGSIAQELASLNRVQERPVVDTVVLAPRGSGAALGAAGLAPVVLHEPGSLEGARDWLRANHPGARRIVLVGSSGSLDSGSHKELQSMVNGFEIDRLIGEAGQGLPVIEQPGPERVLGQARVGRAPAPAGPGSLPGSRVRLARRRRRPLRPLRRR